MCRLFHGCFFSCRLSMTQPQLSLELQGLWASVGSLLTPALTTSSHTGSGDTRGPQSSHSQSPMGHSQQQMWGCGQEPPESHQEPAPGTKPDAGLTALTLIPGDIPGDSWDQHCTQCVCRPLSRAAFPQTGGLLSSKPACDTVWSPHGRQKGTQRAEGVDFAEK